VWARPKGVYVCDILAAVQRKNVWQQGQKMISLGSAKKEEGQTTKETVH